MVRKALFLDRDGTINVDTGYLYKIEDFRLIPGIVELCRAAVAKGYEIVVITNQSGIGRGMYTEQQFLELTEFMKSLFRSHGVEILDVFFCPSVDDAHEDRKPNPGLFLKAHDIYGFDMAVSASLGDKERDVLAGIRAGVGSNFLFSSSTEPTQATARVSDLKDLFELL